MQWEYLENSGGHIYFTIDQKNDIHNIKLHQKMKKIVLYPITTIPQIFKILPLGQQTLVKTFKTCINQTDPSNNEYSVFNKTRSSAEDHICVPSGMEDQINKCKLAMKMCVSKNPTKPIPAIYSCVRTNFCREIEDQEEK